MAKTDYMNVRVKEGIILQLRAIAFYQGRRGEYAGPAQDFIEGGITAFVESLSEAERQRYNEILHSLRTAEEIRKQMG